ncbi:MAG: aldo/keto reductase [Acidobacteria bacterium]|nr:aldo/keto reductase [Acidobacteriota bacterium]
MIPDVSRLGLGTGSLGDPAQSDTDVDRLLGAALDLGITLFDTARSYGLSEERLGRFLRGRRDGVVLSTKVGYGVDGVPDWTPECIRKGIDRALGLLQTGVIDLVHLHSCPLDTLEHSGVVEALTAAVEQGKVRVAAYSGDGPPLRWAARSGAFGSLQCSVNLCDQEALETDLSRPLLAKRPLANAPWRFAGRPVGDEAEPYWERFQTLSLPSFGLPWDELAIRFSAYAPGVSSALVGTRSVSNLRRTAEAVERGPLPKDIVDAIRARYRECGGWPGRI